MEATTTRVHIRWMIRRDLKAGLGQWVKGWNDKRILHSLRQRNRIGMVAEDGAGRVVAYMVYVLNTRKTCDCVPACGWVRLLAIGVRPGARQEGYGAALLAKLIDKTRTHRRPAVVATVPERNLPIQVALRSAGFTCERVIANRFGAEAGYRFVFRT